MTKAKMMARSMSWFQTESMGETEFFERWERLLESVRANRRKYAYAYRKRHPEKHLICQRRNYQKHKLARQKLARQNRIRMKNDPEKLNAYRKYCRERARLRVKQDPEFAIRKRMRTRITMALKRQSTIKSHRTEELVGCTMAELRKHIESQWKPGMSWDNHGRGGWHVDHKKPCISFDLAKIEEQKACFHYTNLQPLWQHENLSKGALNV